MADLDHSEEILRAREELKSAYTNAARSLEPFWVAVLHMVMHCENLAKELENLINTQRNKWYDRGDKEFSDVYGTALRQVRKLSEAIQQARFSLRFDDDEWTPSEAIEIARSISDTLLPVSGGQVPQLDKIICILEDAKVFMEYRSQTLEITAGLRRRVPDVVPEGHQPQADAPSLKR